MTADEIRLIDLIESTEVALKAGDYAKADELAREILTIPGQKRSDGDGTAIYSELPHWKRPVYPTTKAREVAREVVEQSPHFGTTFNLRKERADDIRRLRKVSREWAMNDFRERRESKRAGKTFLFKKHSWGSYLQIEST